MKIPLQQTLVKSLLPFLCSAAALHAAAPSFDGTWKQNMEKSQLQRQEFQIERNPSGTIRFTSATASYDFDLSGREFPTPNGGSVAVRAPNDNTWNFTHFFEGKIMRTNVMVLKKNTLELTLKTVGSRDGDIGRTAVAARVSAGNGFFGRWKAMDVKGDPGTLVISTSGNTITSRSSINDWSCEARFDGKDYPTKLAGRKTKETLAFKKVDPMTIQVTARTDGNVKYIDTMTLSPDGKILTSARRAGAQVTKAVFDRQ